MSPKHDYAILESCTDADRRCPRYALESHRQTRSCVTLLVVVGLLFVAGCQSLQMRMTQRSAKCGALCERAREAREKGNSQIANELIDEALRQKPKDLEMRHQLAETMWNNGRCKEAMAHFTSLCEQQPNDAKLASRLAVMQWEADQHAVATKTAAAALKIDPRIKDAWLIKARGEVENGQLDDALVSYIRLSQLASDDLTTLIELGNLHLKRGHPDRACPLFRSALQHSQATSSQRAEIEWQLGVAYARSERWSLALSILEPAMTRRTASAEDWCFLGWTRMQCGDLDGAQSDVQRALKSDPDSLAARQLARKLDGTFDPLTNPRRVTPATHREASRSKARPD